MKRGILYLGSGEKYLEQAIWSAKQSRKVTELPMALVTDHDTEADVFDEVIVDKTLTRSFFDKPAALRQSPFDKTLFIDCDAYIINEIAELFDILNSFDLAACVDPNEYALRVKGERHFDDLSAAVPEYNTGVVLFRRPQQTTEFFLNWEQTCSEDHLTDQVGFRKALSDTKIQFTTLSPIYNCLINWPMQITGEVSIIHDPNDVIYSEEKSVPKIASRINQTDSYRILHSAQQKDVYPITAISTTAVRGLSSLTHAILAWDRNISKLYTSLRREGFKRTIRRVVRNFHKP